MALPASSPAFSSSSRREARSPGRARVLCARTCACARARVAVVRERSRRGKGGTGVGSLVLLAPSEDPCLALPLAAHGGRRLSFQLSLSSVHSRCLPHRTASGPRVCPLFPVRLFRVPFRFLGGGARPFPPSGERGAPRVGVPPALSPRLPGARRRTEPVSCEGCANGRVVAAAVLPPASSSPPTPVRVPSYRVPARRFKDPPGGSPLRPRGRGGGGARREPSTSGGSRGLPFLGVREPPLGRPWGSPPRARFAGASSVAGPVSVGPDPLS